MGGGETGLNMPGDLPKPRLFIDLESLVSAVRATAEYTADACRWRHTPTLLHGEHGRGRQLAIVP